MSHSSTSSPRLDEQRSTTSGEAGRNELEECDEDTEHPPSNLEILTQYIHLNDPRKLESFLAKMKSKDEIKELVNQRDDAGKSPLDVAAILGRADIIKLLITNGAKIDNFTSKGYSCMHHAAAWGQLKVLKVLVESGGNLKKKNSHGETPQDIALRYHQTDCVEFLDLAAEKKSMRAELTAALEKVKDDKVTTGKISKEEKNLIVTTCMEKLEWLESATSADEVRDQFAFFMLTMQTVFSRLIDSRQSTIQQKMEPQTPAFGSMAGRRPTGDKNISPHKTIME